MSNVAREGALPVKNVRGAGIDNRQLQLLYLLPQWPDGPFPFTSDLVMQLGLPKTASNMASVCRSLARLQKRGRVVAISGQIQLRGRALRWARAPR